MILKLHLFKRFLPKWVKPFIRFIYYRNQQKKVFREFGIRKKQKLLIRKNFDPETNNLIVFLVDGANWFTGKDSISGGIMSIASIYHETKKLKGIHQSDTIMVTHDEANLLLQHTQFDNDILVFRLSQVFSYFTRLSTIVFHIPEYLTSTILHQLQNPSYALKLKKIKNIHFNILNQSIHLMPSPELVSNLKKLATHVTTTAAHDKYCTPELAREYQIPVHKLSVFSSPEQYERTTFEQKENIMIISPDEHPLKDTILQKIKTAYPNLTLHIIKNIPYRDYRNLIKQAKWALTFGEGLDFYFIETVFSGGIAFAAYNEHFFTPAFQNLEGVFADYEVMSTKIIEAMEVYNKNSNYAQINAHQYKTVSSVYQYNEYVDNIRKFYLREYTFSWPQ